MSERNLTRIGKYEVECVIGEGSMGVVYRAVDPLINRRVAIKVMNDAVAQDVSLRERFLREAQTAGSLQHPNVVTIYDFGELEDHLFIAMEYVEGDDLADLLKKDVAIPIAEALDLIIGLLHGLAYAHKRGIIHRDIKPANVRVDSEGKARLMDFGVAHLASSDMTSTGMLLGTPAYMAPEQITGGSVTAETDIFSVGAVLYELLAGRRPFIGDTLQSLMYSILNKAPESLEAIVPKMPSGLHDIVMRALNKDASQRYHSATAMANDLAAIRDSIDPEGKRTSRSLRAAIDTALARETRARERRKVGLQVGTFAAGVVLAVAGVMGVRALLARKDTTRPTSPVAASTILALPPAVRESLPNVTATPAPAPARTNSSTPAASAQRAAVPSTRSSALDDRRASGSVPQVAQAPGSRVADTSPLVAAPPPQRLAPPPATPVQGERPSITQQQSSATAAVPPAPATAPAVIPRENASEQIGTVIGAYARALESLDVNELRRVYPGMSSEQRTAFADFFRSIRTLKATLAVGGLQVDGASAEAQVTGAFDYVTTSGSTEHRSVSFASTFHRDRGTWTLAAVH